MVNVMVFIHKIRGIIREVTCVCEQYIFGFVLVVLLFCLSSFVLHAYLTYAPLPTNLSLNMMFESWTSFSIGVLLVLFIIWFGRSMFVASKIQVMHTKFLKGVSPWSWYRISFYILAAISVIFVYNATVFDEWDLVVGSLILITLLILYLLLSLLALRGVAKRRNATYTYGHGTVGIPHSAVTL